MTTWLVTGGLGFIGSHVVRELLGKMSRDHRVVVIDKNTYAAADGYRLEYYGIRESSRLKIFIGDVRDHTLVHRIAQDYDPDYWVHLAAESHVDRSIDGAWTFTMSNVVGTQVLLDEALAAWKAGDLWRKFRFCLVSTDEVYGSFLEDPDSHPGFKEHQPLAPTNPYAATKASAEHLAMAAYHTHGLPVVITRGSNTLGPLQSPEKFLPRMIGRALQGLSLPVYGDGQQRRQWLHVSDHADGIILACLRGEPGQAYNLGGETCATNLFMAETIQALVGEGRIEHVTDRPGHDTAYKISSLKARLALDWRPSQADLSDQLRLLVDWCRENPGWFNRHKGDLLQRKGLG